MLGSVADDIKILFPCHRQTEIGSLYLKEMNEAFKEIRSIFRKTGEKKSSAVLGEISYTKILSLDNTDTTVVVKIESIVSGTRFVSQLSMLKIDDAWQIIAGLFHAEK